VVTKGNMRSVQSALGGVALRVRSCVVGVWQRKCQKLRGRTGSESATMMSRSSSPIRSRPRHPRTPQRAVQHDQRHRSLSQHEPPVGTANPPCNTLVGPRKTLPVICGTGRVGGRVNHVDYRISPDRAVGFGRHHTPCQCSRHQDLLGAAGPSEVLTYFWPCGEGKSPPWRALNSESGEPLHEGHCRVASIA
jgi:hypothetical protein